MRTPAFFNAPTRPFSMRAPAFLDAHMQYMAPAFVAALGARQEFFKVFLLNLIFGWFPLAWIALMIWALGSETVDKDGAEREEAQIHITPPTAEEIWQSWLHEAKLEDPEPPRIKTPIRSSADEIWQSWLDETKSKDPEPPTERISNTPSADEVWNSWISKSLVSTIET